MDDWLALEARDPYLLPQVSDSSDESEVSHCSIAVARTQNVA